MKDVLELIEGAAPWTPNKTARPGEVLDRFNVPRVGLLHDGGHTFLFAALMGDGEPTSLWAYAKAESGEIFHLLGTSGPDDFDETVESVLANRCVTLAFATNHEIEVVETFDAGLEGVNGLIDRFSKRIEARGKKSVAVGDKLRAMAPAH